MAEVVPAARERFARLSFSLIYPDRSGRGQMRSIGDVGAQRRGPDDGRTLRDLNYEIGDQLAVAVLSK